VKDDLSEKEEEEKDEPKEKGRDGFSPERERRALARIEKDDSGEKDKDGHNEEEKEADRDLHTLGPVDSAPRLCARQPTAAIVAAAALCAFHRQPHFALTTRSGRSRGGSRSHGDAPGSLFCALPAPPALPLTPRLSLLPRRQNHSPQQPQAQSLPRRQSWLTVSRASCRGGEGAQQLRDRGEHSPPHSRAHFPFTWLCRFCEKFLSFQSFSSVFKLSGHFRVSTELQT
jgi:hypothetical protein